jgi:hypothetical protein
MRPVSDAFLRILRGSHDMCARVRVVTGVPTGVNPVGTELAISEGSVRLDANADIRSSVSVSVAAPWPTSPTAPITPYGPELFVERGVVRGDGVREWVALGYFRIDKVKQDQVPDGLLSIDGSDRMAGLRDARLDRPLLFGTGTSVDLVFDTLVLDVYPTVTINFDYDSLSDVFDSPHAVEEDLYGFLKDLVRSRGKVMYFDHAGILQVRTAPDEHVPVWTVNSGAGGVLVGLNREINRVGVYNAVVVTGEAPGAGSPVRAVAYDLNPASPTLWGGQFGKVPRFYGSSFITTEPQAQVAANAMLLRALGLPHVVDFQAIANAALEPLDPVLIEGPDGANVHVLETIGFPLSADGGPMAATTRERTGVAGDQV